MAMFLLSHILPFKCLTTWHRGSYKVFVVQLAYKTLTFEEKEDLKFDD